MDPALPSRRSAARAFEAAVALALVVLLTAAGVVTTTTGAGGATPTVPIALVANRDAKGVGVLRLDENGSALDAHDGEVQLFAGRYHLYGTAYGCGFQFQAYGPFCGWKSYSSLDLRTWRDDGQLFDVSAESWQGNCIIGCYRPHVAFDADRSTYVLWVNTYEDDRGYHVFESQDPAGPFTEVARPQLRVNRTIYGGVNGDEDLFVDHDGTAYLARTDWLNDGDIVIERLDADARNGTGAFVRLGLRRTEAPSLFEHGGRYFLTYSDPNCGYCPGTGTSILSAPTPLGPWGTPGGTTPGDLWALTPAGLAVRGAGVGYSMDGAHWGDTTLTFTATPRLLTGPNGTVSMTWWTRTRSFQNGIRFDLGDDPSRGGGMSLVTTIVRGGFVPQRRSVPLPAGVTVAPGRALTVSSKAVGHVIETRIGGVLVDTIDDGTYVEGRVAFSGPDSGATGFDVRHVTVTSTAGTTLYDDGLSTLAGWDAPVAPKVGAKLTADSCKGQPTAVKTLPTPAGDVVLYQSDVWDDGAFNEGQATTHWEPLSFDGAGNPRPVTCATAFTIPVLGEAAPPVAPAALDSSSGADGFKAVCDITADRWRVQELTPSRSGTLTSVGVTLDRRNGPEGPLDVDLVAIGDDAAVGPPIATTRVGLERADWAPKRVAVAFSVPVVAGRRYGVVLRTAATKGCWGVALSTTGAHFGGPSLVGKPGSYAVVAGGAIAFSTSVSPAPAAGDAVHPVAPRRLLDTRTAGGPMGPGQALTLAIGGGDIPQSGVTAALVNVTAVTPTASGYLTLYPTGAAQPPTSSLNFTAGTVVPNLVLVPTDSAGRINIFNAFGTTHVVVDLAGWVGGAAAPGDGTGRLHAVTPTRVADTRLGLPSPALGPDGSIAIAVTGPGRDAALAAVVPPTGVTAAVLNITATNPTAPTFVTAHPSGTARPNASNLNPAPGQTVAGRVVVPVGPDGRVALDNFAGSVDLVVDVTGWVGGAGASALGGTFTAINPARLLDTRVGRPLTDGATTSFLVAGRDGVPALSAARRPAAVVLNVTLVGGPTATYLTLHAGRTARPPSSDLNGAPGQVVANLVIAEVGVDGRVQVYDQAATTNQVVDVVGWID